jgi:hypothetical protein
MHLSTLISIGLASIIFDTPHSHGHQQLLRGGDKLSRNESEVGSFQILPLDIPLDRVFDVQWNPPGYPTLDTSFLLPPFNDQWTTRDGHYTFAQKDQDGVMSLVRKKTDGTVCSVFEKIDFRAISDEVLMMEGDTPDLVGTGFGTLIKGKSIPAGDEGGTWNTTEVDTEEIAEKWLMKNFHQKGSSATSINAPIEFCPWSDLFPEDTPIVEGGEESLTVVNGEEVQTAIEAIDPSFHV